jgi:hypothetical protein
MGRSIRPSVWRSTRAWSTGSPRAAGRSTYVCQPIMIDTSIKANVIVLPCNALSLLTVARTAASKPRAAPICPASTKLTLCSSAPALLVPITPVSCPRPNRIRPGELAGHSAHPVNLCPQAPSPQALPAADPSPPRRWDNEVLKSVSDFRPSQYLPGNCILKSIQFQV